MQSDYIQRGVAVEWDAQPIHLLICQFFLVWGDSPTLHAVRSAVCSIHDIVCFAVVKLIMVTVFKDCYNYSHFLSPSLSLTHQDFAVIVEKVCYHWIGLHCSDTCDCVFAFMCVGGTNFTGPDRRSGNLHVAVHAFSAGFSPFNFLCCG